MLWPHLNDHAGDSVSVRLPRFRWQKAKKRMKPDGFGGFVERDEEVKPVYQRVAEGVVSTIEGDEAVPAPKRVASAPSPPPAKKSSAATSSSAPAFTLEQVTRLNQTCRTLRAGPGRAGRPTMLSRSATPGWCQIRGGRGRAGGLAGASSRSPGCDPVAARWSPTRWRRRRS